MTEEVMIFAELFPIILSVYDHYLEIRKVGKTRHEAEEDIRTAFFQELNDVDDYPCIVMGLALAMEQNKELTSEIIQEMCYVLDKVMIDRDIQRSHKSMLQTMASRFHTATPMQERKYTLCKAIPPDWQKGDAFIIEMSEDYSKRIGIPNGYFLFYKTGDYINRQGTTIQIMRVAICKEKKEQYTYDELKAMGWIRMQRSNICSFRYLCQIRFTKKNALLWNSRRIGCYPLLPMPSDACDENVKVTMPLYLFCDKKRNIPDYENSLYFCYQQNGIG